MPKWRKRTAAAMLAISTIMVLDAQEAFAQRITKVAWAPYGVGSLASAIAGSSYRLAFTVTIEGLPLVGQVFLGCTYVDSDGDEMDMDARAVRVTSRLDEYKYFVGSEATSIVFTVWRRKITREVLQGMSQQEYKEVMATSNNQEFQDRKRRLDDPGYFMYGRITSTGWIDLQDRIDISDEPLGGQLFT